MYVIVNAGRYVAIPGSKSSFTTSLKRARKFSTEAAARADACGNEHVVSVYSLL